jgi:small-conductance mechanosensitive channel
METRRVAYSIGVTYGTSGEKLKLIPGMIKQIIDSVDNTNFDRVHLKAFGDFAILFEVVYYVLSQDYALYMDVNQEINLAIKSAFDANDIEFAFPTQSIYIEKQ